MVPVAPFPGAQRRLYAQVDYFRATDNRLEDAAEASRNAVCTLLPSESERRMPGACLFQKGLGLPSRLDTHQELRHVLVLGSVVRPPFEPHAPSLPRLHPQAARPDARMK